MGKVFVPEVQQLDEDEAKRIGEIVPLVPSSNRLGLEPDRLKYLMANGLSIFSSGDFLLLDGRNIHCAVAASILAVQRNSLDLLLWDKSVGSYVTRPLTLLDVPKTKNIISSIRAFVVNDLHDSEDQLSMRAITLTKGHDPNFMNPEAIKANMIEILANSHSQDYLVTSGSKIHNVVASCIMARMHGRVNYLLWHAKTNKYEFRCATFGPADLRKI